MPWSPRGIDIQVPQISAHSFANIYSQIQDVARRWRGCPRAALQCVLIANILLATSGGLITRAKNNQLSAKLAATVSETAKVEKTFETVSAVIEKNSQAIVDLVPKIKSANVAKSIQTDATAIYNEHQVFKALVSDLQNEVIPALKKSEALAKKQEKEIVELKSKEHKLLRWITISCLFGMGAGIAVSVQFSPALGKTIAITFGCTAIFCAFYSWLLTERWVVESLMLGAVIGLLIWSTLRIRRKKSDQPAVATGVPPPHSPSPYAQSPYAPSPVPAPPPMPSPLGYPGTAPPPFPQQPVPPLQAPIPPLTPPPMTPTPPPVAPPYAGSYN